MSDILDYVRHLSWIVTEHPNNAKEYHDDKHITPTRLHETLFERDVILSLHTSRYCDSKRLIAVSGTVYEVLLAIYNFYNGLILTLSDMKDLWHLDDGYYKEAKRLFNCGSNLSYADIIGEAKWFEGFKDDDDEADYRLVCGT